MVLVMDRLGGGPVSGRVVRFQRFSVWQRVGVNHGFDGD